VEQSASVIHPKLAGPEEAGWGAAATQMLLMQICPEAQSELTEQPSWRGILAGVTEPLGEEEVDEAEEADAESEAADVSAAANAAKTMMVEANVKRILNVLGGKRV
jgi:hypothetical protein